MVASNSRSASPAVHVLHIWVALIVGSGGQADLRGERVEERVLILIRLAFAGGRIECARRIAAATGAGTHLTVFQRVHEPVSKPFTGKNLVFGGWLAAIDHFVAHLFELAHIDAHDLHVIVDVPSTCAGLGRDVVGEVHYRSHAGYAAHRAERFERFVIELGIAGCRR